MSVAPLQGALLPWLALLLGFSPALVELVQNLAAEPADRPSLLALPLLALCLRGDRGGRSRPALAYGLVASALGLQVLGVVTATWGLARLSLPLAGLGLAARLGWPSLPAAAIAFWVVPVPDFVTTWTSPGLEVALGATAAAVVGWIGIGAHLDGTAVQLSGATLELRPEEAGAALGHAVSALAWYVAVRRGAGPRGYLARQGLALLALLPLQIASLAVGFGLAQAALPARAWLDLGAALVVAGGVVAVVERRS